MLKGMTMEVIPCSICNEGHHRAGKCPELWNSKITPQKGGDTDEDTLILRTSGNFRAHDFNHTSGSREGHLKPLSVIKI